MSPDIFRRKDDQAYKKKQYALQHRQEQTDNAQQDAAPAENQNSDAFDLNIHVSVGASPVGEEHPFAVVATKKTPRAARPPKALRR